jgi:hypothetical protein
LPLTQLVKVNNRHATLFNFSLGFPPSQAGTCQQDGPKSMIKV